MKLDKISLLISFYTDVGIGFGSNTKRTQKVINLEQGSDPFLLGEAEKQRPALLFTKRSHYFSILALRVG